MCLARPGQLGFKRKGGPNGTSRVVKRLLAFERLGLARDDGGRATSPVGVGVDADDSDGDSDDDDVHESTRNKCCAVAVGSMHTAAITPDGVVVAAGANSVSQLGVGSGAGVSSDGFVNAGALSDLEVNACDAIDELHTRRRTATERHARVASTLTHLLADPLEKGGRYKKSHLDALQRSEDAPAYTAEQYRQRMARPPPVKDPGAMVCRYFSEVLVSSSVGICLDKTNCVVVVSAFIGRCLASRVQWRR